MQKCYLFFLFSLLNLSAFSQKEFLNVKIPTVAEETDYVWRTIIDTRFFEKFKYEVSLPQGPLIEELKEKARQQKLLDADYNRLLAFMSNVVYKKEAYISGFNKINEQKALLNKMVKELKTMKKNWAFKMFDTYEIKLTLYGPGGSYDPETGSIVIYTTAKGDFKQYKNPANTLIHEIMHIGTEASIMNKYRLNHPLKERIIDNLVLIKFSKYLPDYRAQSFGDKRIDPYLKNKAHLKDLENIVAQFLADHEN